MFLIRQQDAYGCGLACVAALIGANYATVAAAYRKQAQRQGFTCRELVKILAAYHLNYEYKYLKPRWRRKIYQQGVIVFIKRNKRYPAGHFLLRDHHGWMDPWINFCSPNNQFPIRAGIRKRLPGKPIYALFPKK